MAKGGGGEGGLSFDSSDPLRFPFLHQHRPIVINSFPDLTASSSSSGHATATDHLHASSRKLIAAMDHRHHQFPVNLNSSSSLSHGEVNDSSDQKPDKVIDEMDFFAISNTARAGHDTHHQPHGDADREMMSGVRSAARLELNVNVSHTCLDFERWIQDFIDRVLVTEELSPRCLISD